MLGTIPVIVALLAISILHFDPEIVFGITSVFSKLIGVRVPDIWTYIQPVMPALNVIFYLLGAIAVYLISKEYINTDRYIYFAVAAYMIYFPLAGIDWSIFTTISIFPSLYLLGFYFYKTKSRLISALLFILSGATFLIFFVIVMISGLGILLGDRKRNISEGRNYYAISVMLVSFMLFFLSLTQGYRVGYYGSVNVVGYSYLLTSVSTITFAKPLFFIILLIPVITFGFFGPRLLPVTIPYYIFGIIIAAAGRTPETLLVILDLALPLLFILSIRRIGKKVKNPIVSPETRILKFVLFSLVLMNILVFISYIPFMGILSKFLGL